MSLNSINRHLTSIIVLGIVMKDNKMLAFFGLFFKPAQRNNYLPMVPLVGTGQERPCNIKRQLRSLPSMLRRSVELTAETVLRLSKEYWPATSRICLSIPPNLSVSNLMRKMSGLSLHTVQLEFPLLKKRCRDGHFWGKGYFSTTNGAIIEDIVFQYLESHFR
jgi:hypothetical protein